MSDRFWSKVDKQSEGCWVWTASTTWNGYGQFRNGGRRDGTGRSHRIAYEDLVGPIPEGMTLDHLCRNRLCVNPAHLEVVSIAENLRRGLIARGMRRAA